MAVSPHNSLHCKQVPLAEKGVSEMEYEPTDTKSSLYWWKALNGPLVCLYVCLFVREISAQLASSTQGRIILTKERHALRLYWIFDINQLFFDQSRNNIRAVLSVNVPQHILFSSFLYTGCIYYIAYLEGIFLCRIKPILPPRSRFRGQIVLSAKIVTSFLPSCCQFFPLFPSTSSPDPLPV